MPGVTHPEAGGQGDVLPTLGGASRAPGLPQAAAKRLLRAWLTPTPEGEADNHKEAPCRGRAAPVCRFRGGGEGGATETGISAALGRVWGGGCPGQS